MYHVCSQCHLSIRRDPRHERPPEWCPRCLGRHGKWVAMFTSPLNHRQLTGEHTPQAQPHAH